MTDRPLLIPARLARALVAGRVSEIRIPAGPALAEAGDRFYTRELVAFEGLSGEPPAAAAYAADGAAVDLSAWPPGEVLPENRLARRYPGRWASRFTLIVRRAWAHPLLEITPAQAVAEGLPPAPPRPPGLPRFIPHPCPRAERLALWDEEHPGAPSAGNPLAAAYEVEAWAINIAAIPEAETA